MIRTTNLEQKLQQQIKRVTPEEARDIFDDCYLEVVNDPKRQKTGFTEAYLVNRLIGELFGLYSLEEEYLVPAQDDFLSLLIKGELLVTLVTSSSQGGQG